MSLRARLTLLNSTLLGGVLLLFGVLVYILVSALLLDQVDRTLNQTVKDILSNSRVGSVGELNVVTLPSLELTASVYVQYWDRERHLQMSSPGIRDLSQPLDPAGINSSKPVFRDISIRNIHLRVLTVPLLAGARPVGILQAATNLGLVDTVRNSLLSILVGLTIISMVLAAGVSWFSIRQALSPLATVTQTAEQITHADDLSRRIPALEHSSDEIGALVRAFNRTLERLENLFTSQQRFLADVSHELRTPLTVIKGNADLIRKLGPDDESLDTIKDEADRLTRMVGDLLLLAQAESGKLPLTMSPVALDELLTDVFQQIRILAGEKVHLKLTEIDQIVVSGDRDRLKQVLINLTSNAIHYTPAGGEVYLSLSRAGETARIVVRDTGPGIPAADLPHIFDRFYRGEKSRTRSKTSGFGLGLSIASFIAEAHGGRIEVDSHEGQGTAFAVYLPISEEKGL
ncbi:MAG: HAMP domain-containing sensor histidine kinase [Chloroflexi bacterium]|nr:HAMP domain-containing sensor histidine kinase [Chloroflexota bacterium]